MSSECMEKDILYNWKAKYIQLVGVVWQKNETWSPHVEHKVKLDRSAMSISAGYVELWAGT